MDRTLLLLLFLIGPSSAASDSGLQCTNPYEEEGCVLSCPPERSCSNRHFAIPCVPPTKPCTPQCVCIDGFARNVEGVCVTFEQCDQCPGYKQHFECDGPYDPQCESACRCDAGYSPGGNSTCVQDNPPMTVIASPPPSSSPAVNYPPSPPSPAVIFYPPSPPAKGIVYNPPSPAIVYQPPSPPSLVYSFPSTKAVSQSPEYPNPGNQVV